MATPKIAITIDAELLWAVDLWVKEGRFPNRSKAIQAAIREEVERWKRTSLAEACAKMTDADRAEEQAIADEVYEEDLEEEPW